MGRQSWIGVGQVAFDAVEDPQLAPAQAHDVMITSGDPAASSRRGEAGVKQAA